MLYGQISIDPEVMSGAPVFAGTRVPIQNLFDYLESGEDLSEFLDDFPSVTKEPALNILKRLLIPRIFIQLAEQSDQNVIEVE